MSRSPSNQQLIRRGRKRRSRFASIALAVLLAVAVGTVGVGFLRLPFFAVQKIETVGAFGNQNLANDINKLKGQNILLLNTKTIAAKLRQTYPEVDRLEIHKNVPASLTVIVAARIPLAVLLQTAALTNEVTASPSARQSASQSASTSAARKQNLRAVSGYYIDKNAVPFLPLTEQELLAYQDASASRKLRLAGHLPGIFLSGESTRINTKVANPVVVGALQFISLYKDGDIIDIVPKNSTDFSVTMRDSVVVMVTTQKDILTQVVALQTLFGGSTIESRKVGQVDLRFKKPVVIQK